MADDLCDAVKNARLAGVAADDKTRDDGNVPFQEAPNPRVKPRLAQLVLPMPINA